MVIDEQNCQMFVELPLGQITHLHNKTVAWLHHLVSPYNHSKTNHQKPLHVYRVLMWCKHGC